MQKKLIITGILLLAYLNLFAQENDKLTKQDRDSIYIQEVELGGIDEPGKVLHAEPLYIDLIRDLGARKGEKEWNVGFGLTDNINHDEYEALVEYEWAVADRLGLEVELPFTFYHANGSESSPKSSLNSLKTAIQYTFLVDMKHKTSLAIGYINELELTDFSSYGKSQLFTGNVFNPFFVAAKRWGNNFHTLLYTGPMFHYHFNSTPGHTVWQINSNFHYMISGTRDFIGLEINKELTNNNFDMVLRPQMRVGVTEHLLVGIVTGIPINRENQRFSTFLRIIYEPS